MNDLNFCRLVDGWEHEQETMAVCDCQPYQHWTDPVAKSRCRRQVRDIAQLWSDEQVKINSSPSLLIKSELQIPDTINLYPSYLI